MKKSIIAFLLVFLILGMQSVFAKGNSGDLKNEISFYGIYDYKFFGAGEVNDHSFRTDTEDSSFDSNGDFGVGLNYRYSLSENWKIGPSFSFNWAETKNDEDYQRFTADASLDCSVLKSENFEMFTELGVGVDYSQLETYSTIGFDVNLGLGLEYSFTDQFAMTLIASANYLTEVYERDKELCSASQFDVPVKLGLAIKF